MIPACIDPTCPHWECATCGHDQCPDRTPSPGEPDTCAPCWDLEAATRHAIRDEPAGDYSWNGDAA